MNSLSTTNILIIESNESEAFIIGEILTGENGEEWQIFLASTLQEAFSLLEKQRIDIILVDLFLDDSFGINTFNSLIKKYPGIPFIVLTDIDDDLIGKTAVNRGAQDYIIKSDLDISVLQRSINHAIERKKTEEQLRKSEEKYRELFVKSKDAIYMSTVNGDFIDINPAGLALFGYEANEIDQLRVNDLYDNPFDRELLKEELEANGEVENYEVLLIKKDRVTKLHCLLSTIVIYGEKKEIIGYQGIIKDITAKKNAEEALFRSMRDLDQANKELNYLNATLEEKVQLRTAELKKEMEVVENQHKEIKESINYAKRIQASILPAEEKIKEHFPNSFIYYEPKDIVSGDFYWFEYLKDNPMLAIVDCTGHGVPGAFMSIIGYTQLNEIIGDEKMKDPGLILKELDIRVRQALNQNTGNESNSKDGMELGILSFNKVSRELKYAGAMRPLYFVRDGELSILKGDKFAIGGVTLKPKKFTTHSIKVKKDDSLYLFSDGYPDQFGGPKGKKFMTKNVASMVQKIAHLSMKEQGQVIKKAIHDWMQNEEQVDDILITGIKF